jgi:hypothetical protein
MKSPTLFGDHSKKELSWKLYFKVFSFGNISIFEAIKATDSNGETPTENGQHKSSEKSKILQT